MRILVFHTESVTFSFTEPNDYESFCCSIDKGKFCFKLRYKARNLYSNNCNIAY